MYIFSGDVSKEEVFDCMKAAIHQALVLASENALANRVYLPQGGYRDTTVDKQSILDIEKLIV